MAAEIKMIYEEVKEINENVKLLLQLYKQIMDIVIPEVEPEEDEIKAILTEDKLVNKKEFLKHLQE